MKNETKGKYNVQAETKEALEMFGKGYEPAIEIESARTVTERRNGKLIETERAAFVKIYTTFKDELKTIEGEDLKVWLYLALSVNRFTGDARPGLRKIAEDTGMAVNTARAAIDRLESKDLLDVIRNDGIQNCYRPSDYVSVKKETVSKTDTPAGAVSKTDTTVSKNRRAVSNQYRKSAQLEELEEPEKEAATPRLSSSELEEVKTEANQTVDGFLENERRIAELKIQGKVWRGRELCMPQYLPYGDWWHEKTQQHMYGAKGKAKVNPEWLKAFKEFYENEIPISVLNETYDAEIAWKKIISKPSELVAKAKAIAALPAPKAEAKEARNIFDPLLDFLQRQREVVTNE